MEPIITVSNIGKRYRIGGPEVRYDTFAAQIMGMIKAPINNFRKLRDLKKFGDEDDDTTFWALQDINFNVNEGEVLGIIGHNGAGKSTLLKILSRITEPSLGEISIRGRVSSLLEVGTGFHPDLTGRDNIYMNGTILGMRKKEIDAKLEEIIEFSGITKHIDTPVKRYSSGMTVRLAFSVAAHLEPEILIIDEVLAVGDASFQKKCLGKMKDVSGQGRTVLFVSHNMGAVQNLCTRGILLKSGRKIYDGAIDQVILKYMEGESKEFKNHVVFDPPTDIQMTLNEVKILKNGVIATESVFDFQDEIGFDINLTCKEDMPNRGVVIHCRDQFETIFQTFDLSTQEHLIERRAKGNYKVRVRLPTPLLKEGLYYFDFESGFFGKGTDQMEKNVFEIEVKILSKNPRYQSASRSRAGRIHVEPKWEIIHESI